MFGVAAPVETPPPYTPRSPQPTSSNKITIILGEWPKRCLSTFNRCWADDSCLARVMDGS
ncbi:hypothetical protein D3C73_895880 [compost metagenome]